MTNTTGNTTVLKTNPYLEISNQGHTIHFEMTKQQHLLGRDITVADLVVPQEWQVVGRCQAFFRKQEQDYQIYDGNGHQPSTNGLFIGRVRITATSGYRLTNGIYIQIGQNPKNLIELKYFNPSNPVPITSPAQHSIYLGQKSVLIGRDETANLLLDAPTVSRRHATIDTDAQGRYILRDHSTNGVFVNGQQVNDTVVLQDGAIIQIGPFTLVLRGSELQMLDKGEQIRLDAHKLVIEYYDKKMNRTMRRLDDISLAIEPGHFVALVGSSGAGKSTLMRTLLGIEQTTKGVVYLNSEDLRKNFNIYRTQIGYVPQDDIVHSELTVAEVFSYTAQLRLPPEINLDKEVNKALEAVQLLDSRNKLVRQLSGGQRKRVSIGVELLAEPKLFFMDEPTSGLDPGLDKQMMQLLQELAHQGGRTIILVTHATANIRLCDRIVFVGRGGRLCYFGLPEEALKFFDVQDFADIYIKLQQEEEVIKKAEEFHNSDDRKRYIDNYLSPGNQHPAQNSSPSRKRVSFWGQLSLLTRRYLQLILRDRVYLGLTLLTAPIGICLIPLAVTNKEPLVLGSQADPSLAPLALRVLFVFTCAALWVGFSSSVQEIVKESAIYLRERLVNLGLFAYLGSKVTVLSCLALVQTLLIILVILFGFKSPNSELISWPLGLLITTFLTLLASFNLGLLVSASVKNSNQANSALPLLLLPQIIFSGVLFKMEGVASKLSWLMLSRWSVGAYGTLVNVNKMVPTAPNGNPLPNLPFEGSSVYNSTWQNLGLNWAILGIHTTVYLAIALWLQKQKDKL